MSVTVFLFSLPTDEKADGMFPVILTPCSMCLLIHEAWITLVWHNCFEAFDCKMKTSTAQWADSNATCHVCTADVLDKGLTEGVMYSNQC